MKGFRFRLVDAPLALLLITFAFSTVPVFGQADRYALVIGNSNYAGMPRLKNPVNDATDLTAALKRLGFKVTLLTNASRKAMNQAIVAFREALAQDRQSEGIFFFAGHGVQSKGVNYLIPVGANIQAEVDLDDEAVNAQKILGSLEEARNRVNLVILDACRDNPLSGTLRSAVRGLAVLTSAPPETLILYSTAAGQTAADGEGRNSPFAQALLAHIADAGDVTQVVKAITGDVKKATGGRQTPYVYMGLSVDFTLNKSAQSVVPPKKPALTVEKAYGSIKVEAQTRGTLYLNGVSMGKLTPGSSARLDDVETGQVSLEMRYEDGKTETQTVRMLKRDVTAVSFTYIVQPKSGANALTAKWHSKDQNSEGTMEFIGDSWELVGRSSGPEEGKFIGKGTFKLDVSAKTITLNGTLSLTKTNGGTTDQTISNEIYIYSIYGDTLTLTKPGGNPTTWTRVRMQGASGILQLLIATDATFPPMEFVDANKNIVGFDIDLMNAAAAAGGFTVEFKNTAWNGIFAGLVSRKYDAVMSSVAITDERKNTMDFSIPYINAGQVLTVRADMEGVTTLSDLNGKTVGAQIETTGAFAIDKVKEVNDITEKTYNDIGLAFEDLANGLIDGVVVDLPTAASYVLQNAKYKGRLKIVGEPITEEYYGVVVEKGNKEVLDIINAGLKKLQEAGANKPIESKWLK